MSVALKSSVTTLSPLAVAVSSWGDDPEPAAAPGDAKPMHVATATATMSFPVVTTPPLSSGSDSCALRVTGMSPKTIVFFPEGAFGPTNNCVGIGAVLRERGHRVVFVIEESFAGTLEARGFEERLMRLGPAPAEPEVPGQFWIDFIRDTAPVFRKTTLEQLGQFMAPTWQALIDGSKYVDPRLAEIFDEVAPDVIVEDNVVAFPAISASGRPWVRIVSCNPMEMKDPLIAPLSSGYPVADGSEWPAFF